MTNCCTKKCYSFTNLEPLVIKDKVSFINENVKVYKCKSSIKGPKQKSRDYFRVFHLPGCDGQLTRVCKKAFMKVTRFSSESIHKALENAKVCEENGENVNPLTNTVSFNINQNGECFNVDTGCQQNDSSDFNPGVLPLFVEHYNFQITSTPNIGESERKIKVLAATERNLKPESSNLKQWGIPIIGETSSCSDSTNMTPEPPEMSPPSVRMKSAQFGFPSPLSEVSDIEGTNLEMGDQIVPGAFGKANDKKFGEKPKMPDILQSTLPSSPEMQILSDFTTTILPGKFHKATRDVTRDVPSSHSPRRDATQCTTFANNMLNQIEPPGNKYGPHIQADHNPDIKSMLDEISANSYLHSYAQPHPEVHTEFHQVNIKETDKFRDQEDLNDNDATNTETLKYQAENVGNETHNDAAVGISHDSNPCQGEVGVILSSVPDSGRYIALSGKRSFPPDMSQQSHQTKRFYQGPNNIEQSMVSHAEDIIYTNNTVSNRTNESATHYDRPSSNTVMENISHFSGSHEDIMSVLSEACSVDSEELYAKTSALRNFLGVENENENENENYQQSSSVDKRNAPSGSRRLEYRNKTKSHEASNMNQFMKNAQRLYAETASEKKGYSRPVKGLEEEIPDISKLSIKDNSKDVTNDTNNAMSLPDISRLSLKDGVEHKPKKDYQSGTNIHGWHTASSTTHHEARSVMNPRVIYDARTDQISMEPIPGGRIPSKNDSVEGPFESTFTLNSRNRRSVRGLECTIQVRPRPPNEQHATQAIRPPPYHNGDSRSDDHAVIRRKKKSSPGFLCCFSGTKTH